MNVWAPNDDLPWTERWPSGNRTMFYESNCRRLRIPLIGAYFVLLHFEHAYFCHLHFYKEEKTVILSCTGTIILAKVIFCLFACWHVCRVFEKMQEFNVFFNLRSKQQKLCELRSAWILRTKCGGGSPSNMTALPSNRYADHSRMF